MGRKPRSALFVAERILSAAARDIDTGSEANMYGTWRALKTLCEKFYLLMLFSASAMKALVVLAFQP